VKTHATCCAIAALLFSSFDVNAVHPVRSRDWRPVHASEMAFPVLPLPFWVGDSIAPSAGAPQWVQIDPATGAIVPRTIPAALRPPLQPEPLQPMQLRMTPAGHLYLDTRGFQNVVTMKLAADGSLHVGCNDVSHQHDQTASGHADPAALPAGEQP
jgi:hypothetical protein